MAGNNQSPQSANAPSREFWLVIPRLQIPIVLIAISGPILSIVLTAFYLKKITGQLGNQITDLALDSSHPINQALKSVQDSWSQYLIIVGLAVVAVQSITALLLSHKIAGPIYRMIRYLQENSQEKSPEVRKLSFRDGDFLHDVADLFNAFLEKKNILKK